MTDLQLSDNLLPHVLFGIDTDDLVVSTKPAYYDGVAYLSGHDDLGRGMHNL
jgi:hypothetical protein